jgi:hypothetical protein
MSTRMHIYVYSLHKVSYSIRSVMGKKGKTNSVPLKVISVLLHTIQLIYFLVEVEDKAIDVRENE